MIKKIEMPNWGNLIKDKYCFENEDHRSSAIDWKGCIDWFKENIEPVNEMLDKAVRVKGSRTGNYAYEWSEESIEIDRGSTHQAYLIDIQPITHESCADVLRDIIQLKHITHYEHQLVERAKAALERES